MKEPLFVELFAGLHGWGEGAVVEGFWVVGFDIVDMCGELRLPRPKGIDLVIQDVLTLHGKQFKDAAVIVASPPCQAYSYRAMPWKRAKALPPPDNSLFDACFRIQREACEAAGRNIPLIVENVCGAQKWVGRAAWHFGSFYLWGDIPALMPITMNRTAMKQGVAHRSDGSTNFHGKKVPGLNFSKRGGPAFNSTAAQRYREGVKVAGLKPGRFPPGGLAQGAIDRSTKQGGDWFNKEARANGAMSRFSSKSNSRKAASAHISKIPFPLAQHIARCFK